MFRLIFAGLALLSLALSNVAFASDKHDKKERHRSGQLAFWTVLSGAQETLPTETEASARSFIRFDKGLTKAVITVGTRNINSMVVAAHLHCAPAGSNGPPAVGLMQPGPLTEFPERVKLTITNANFTGLDCIPTTGKPVNNIASLYFAMRAGDIYLNLHTPDFPPGELRGQYIPRS